MCDFDVSKTKTHLSLTSKTDGEFKLDFPILQKNPSQSFWARNLTFKVEQRRKLLPINRNDLPLILFWIHLLNYGLVLTCLTLDSNVLGKT